MIDALDDEQSNRLKFLSETNANSKELEEILSQDCPLCGIISTNVISKPIVVSDIGLSLF